MSFLEVQQLVKSFPSRARASDGQIKSPAVNGLSFQVRAGEIVGLFGRSAAGKSTTLRMIAGHYFPDSGEVFLKGERVTKYTLIQRRRRRISHFDEELLIRKSRWWKPASYITVEQAIRTVLNDLEVYPPLGRRMTRQELAHRLEEILDEFELQKVRTNRLFSLAHGERLRLELARCLASEPVLLLLDEPFASLDRFWAENLARSLQRLKERDTAILLTDHSPFARDVVDRSIFIEHGRHVNYDPLSQPLPDRPQIRNVLQSPPKMATSRSEIHLTVTGLKKYYASRCAVDGVDMHVGPGEIVGLLGPNGAGKTTTIRSIVGSQRSTAGRIEINGQDVTAWRMHNRAKLGIGYLPQNGSIFTKLTVEQNILAILEYSRRDRQARRNRLDELLAQFGLYHNRGQLATTLSGGERRRLEIARCLASEPSLLVLDEPFTGIDPVTIHTIQDLLSELRDRGMSILLSDHRERETLTLTNRNYILFAGKVLISGDAETVLSAPSAQNYYFGARFDANNIIAAKEHRGRDQRSETPSQRDETHTRNRGEPIAEWDHNSHFDLDRTPHKVREPRPNGDQVLPEEHLVRGGRPPRNSAGPLSPSSRQNVGGPKDVHFTVFHPRSMRSGEWNPLLAFAHRKDKSAGEIDPMQEVQRRAEEILKSRTGNYEKKPSEGGQPLHEGAVLRFVPQFEGIEVAPAERTLTWIGPVHEAEFQIRAPIKTAGRTIAGTIQVYCGLILLAEVDVEGRVTTGVEQSLESTRFETIEKPSYRNIFVSYSHRDQSIVEQVEQYIELLGDRYLRDARDLRAGEVWDDRLVELIESADIFQLFWSKNSMHSRYVQREWEYALSLQRPGFVRPVYWEDPFPESPSDNLPPHELRRLHFARIGSAASVDPVPKRAKPNLVRGKTRQSPVAESDTSTVPKSVSDVLKDFNRPLRTDELMLEVEFDPAGGRLRFTAFDGTVSPPFRTQSKPFQQSPANYAAELAKEMSDLSRGKSVGQRSNFEESLEAFGLDLWSELLPADLQTYLLDRRKQLSTLMIFSDNDPIPWELLRFPDSSESAGFLADQIDIARWRPHLPLTSSLSLDSAALISSNDHGCRQEIQHVAALLAAKGIAACQQIDTVEAMLDLFSKMAAGDEQVHLLHIASHTEIRPSGLTQMEIQVGGDGVSPLLLAKYEKAFRTASPLVVMNACTTDVKRPSWTRLSSWADRFLSARVAAFIGTLWEIRDVSAAQFAEEFYSGLLNGRTLGQAVRQARSALSRNDGDPTRLSYVLYGDPAARLQIGRGNKRK